MGFLTPKTFQLSWPGYYLDFVLAPLAIAGLVAGASVSGDLSWRWLGLAAMGLFLWTLAEYLIHRFVFHGISAVARAHWRHHHLPQDPIGVASVGTVAVFGLVAATMVSAIGVEGLAVLAGLLAGYLAYIVAHEAMHHRAPAASSWLGRAKARHDLHHDGAPVNFGVVTPLWDRVFGTYAALPGSD